MKSLTTKLGVVGILMISCATTNAQTFTIQSGKWSSPSTWFNGIVPDASSGSITINHKIILPADTSLVIDQLTLNDTLILQTGSVLTLNNTPGTEAALKILAGGLKVYGRIICLDSATLSGTTSTNTIFYDGATYQHHYFGTAGTPPLAFWYTNSTLEITGYKNTKTLNNVLWSQSFGNVIYNCPDQASFIEFAGRLKNIRGNFLISNTNGRVIRLSLDLTTSTAISIGGNLIVMGNSSVWFSRAANTTVTIGGDFKIVSTSTASSYLTTTGSCVVNVAGNFEMNSSTILRFASGTLTGNGTLRVGKNFLFDAGTITVSTGTGVGTIEMNGTSSQLLSSKGKWASGVKLSVANANSVVVQDNSKIESDVIIKPSGKLVFPSTNFTLEGNLTEEVGGSIQSSSGTLSLTGTLNQVVALAGDTVHHLSISKSSGTSVTLTSAAALSGVLNILSPNTTLVSNGNLTLLSSSDDGQKDASISALPSGSAVTGNVTVQRFMQGEGRIYRYISSPVNNASVGSLMDDFPITGTFTDPSNGSGINSTTPSFYYYDETRAGQLGWIAYPSSGFAADNVLEPGRGYAAFIRKASIPTTWDVTGVINQGEVTFNINFTNFNDAANDGWNLVGNPYPSAIDWNAVGAWDKTHINTGIAVRDNGSGNFLYWDGAVGSLGSGRIAKGQSFWIKANAATPQLKIREAAKTNTSTPFYRTKPSQPDYLEISINTVDKNDKTYLRLRPTAFAGYDSLDVPKFENDFLNLSLDVSGISLAISAIDQLDCNQPMPLNLSFPKKPDGSFVQSPVGSYTISAQAHGVFTGSEIFLYDQLSNQFFNLAAGDYTFNITVDTTTSKRDRFQLHFNAPTLRDSIFVLADSSICDNEPMFKVELESLQPGTRYNLFTDDEEIASYFHPYHVTDSTHIVEIETVDLKNANSLLTLKAMNTCYERELKSIKIFKQQTRIPQLFANTACNTDTITLRIHNANQAIAFNWYDSKQNMLTQTSDSVLRTVIGKSTKFCASSVFEYGCESALVEVEANVVWFTEPIITEHHGRLYSNYTTGNQWSLNGSRIEGNTNAFIEPDTSGLYTLTILNSGCVDSAFHYFIYQNDRCRIFPNPVEQTLQVVAPTEEHIEKIEIIHLTGQIVKSFSIDGHPKAEAIVMSELAPGIYILKIFTTTQCYNQRVMKK